MKRLFSLCLLLLCSLPVGVSISGCGVNASNYCPAPNNFTKISQVYQIVLQPTNSTVSLAYGQTRILASPTAENCIGNTVGVASYSYGSTNPSLLDVSPGGVLCAGTWNRNSGGGIQNYTVCTPPSNATINGLLGSASAPNYGNLYALITAAAGPVTSNAVQIFVHPPVTSVASYQGTSTGSCSSSVSCGTSSSTIVPACLSQGTTVPYCSVVCNGATDITAAVGNITYAGNNTSVVSFAANTVNQQQGIATANQPGSTVVTATISLVSSNAGSFSTCPPAAININVNGSDSVTVNPNNNQQISLGTSTSGEQILDTRGVPFTSLTGLTYTSTNPSTLTVSTTGLISPKFASNGDIYAACLPPGCNPSEVNQIGQPAPSDGQDIQTGNGLPIISNPLRVVAPGAVSSILYMVNFSNPSLAILNNNGSIVTQPIQLPYTPNSAVVSQDGSRLYLGSSTELMVLNTATNAIVAVNRNVPGKVLAVSPDGSTAVIFNNVINNGVPNNAIYLYNTSAGTFTSPYTGPALRAQFTPDNQTVYIATGTTSGIVYNKFTGWATYALPGGASDVAVVTPAVGAFFAGTSTTALGYCPNIIAAPPIYFPIAANVAANTSVINSSNDGEHVFGANDAAGLTFSDIQTDVPSGANGLCPLADTGLTIPTNLTQYSDGSITGATLTGVDSTSATFNLTNPTPNTTYTAFVTYTDASSSAPAKLPVYQLTSGAGGSAQFALIPLATTSAGTPTAPTSGAVSPDGKTFFVTTSGDNLLHFITIPQPSTTAPPTQLPSDNGAPVPTNLVDANGSPVPADLVLIRPYQTAN